VAGHIATAGSIHHGTPEHFIERARKLNNGIIDLDPCSNATSIVHATTEFVLPAHNGLKDSWHICPGRTFGWINPPFGRYYMHITGNHALSKKEYDTLVEATPAEASNYEPHTLSEWVAKANGEFWAFKDSPSWTESVMILPASVDTGIWHDIIFTQAVAWIALKGRVKYLGTTQSAPNASALVYWGKDPQEFANIFGDLGRVFPCDGMDNLPPKR
jgi:hypothetical protein